MKGLKKPGGGDGTIFLGDIGKLVERQGRKAIRG